MSTRMYLVMSALIFGIIADIHLLRIIKGWPLILGSWSAPLWFSWLGVIGPTFLFIWAVKLAFRSR